MYRIQFPKLDHFKIVEALWKCKSLQELLHVIKFLDNNTPFMISRYFIEKKIVGTWKGEMIGTDSYYQLNWFELGRNKEDSAIFIATLFDFKESSWIPNPKTTGIIWKYTRSEELEVLANRVYGFKWDENDTCYSIYNTLFIIQFVHESAKNTSVIHE
jgi:hypothetical protein